MDAETQNVIRVFRVKSLLVLLLVVHYPNCCHMINNFTCLGVKQVIAAVISSISGNELKPKLIQITSYDYLKNDRKQAYHS